MAKNSKKDADAGKEVIRVTFRFHGRELEQIREVRDMLSLNSCERRDEMNLLLAE